MSGLVPGEAGNMHSRSLPRTSPVPPSLMASLYNRDFSHKYQTEDVRDDNHNSKPKLHEANLYSKDSSIAALEAFHREYLPSPLPSKNQISPSSHPSPLAPLPPGSPRFSPGSIDSFQQNSSFEEQFKELYEFNNDPTRKRFLDDLFNFMQDRGTPINRLPIMAKQVLDLYELYNLVVEKGGLVEVINKKQWQEIIKGLNLPSSITSAAFTLRSQYTRYLYPYECREKNLSNPNELQSAIESHRREGRRQGYEGMHCFLPSSNYFPLPPSSFPHPLPQFPLLPPQLRPKTGEDMSISPGGNLSSNLNQMDMTRFALMKMMGQTRLPFPPNMDQIEKYRRMQEMEEEEEEIEDDDDQNYFTDQKNKERKIKKTDFIGIKGESSSPVTSESSMVVSMELNSVKYQGVLFAQPLDFNRSQNIQI